MPLRSFPGALQFAGVSVNVVTYVCLVISVGLLVDFLMHILLRYYESHGRTREEKVRDTLESMGPSILVGGLSTFLGVVPLAFSTNEVAKVVFISFFAMVTFGFGHGLIFLPVVLSIVGPTNTRPQRTKRPQKGLLEKKDSSEQLQPHGSNNADKMLANELGVPIGEVLLVPTGIEKTAGYGEMVATDDSKSEEHSISADSQERVESRAPVVVVEEDSFSKDGDGTGEVEEDRASDGEDGEIIMM